MTNCCKCNSTMVGAFFELVHSNRQDELHLVCAECLAQLHAARGCAPYFRCPHESCHKKKIVGHACWKKTERRLRGNQIILSQSEERQPPIYIQEPTVHLDPCRVYKSETVEWKERHFMVSLQFWDKSTKKVRSLAVPVEFDKPCDAYTDKTKEILVDVMTMLYHVFFFPCPCRAGSIQRPATSHGRGPSRPN